MTHPTLLRLIAPCALLLILLAAPLNAPAAVPGQSLYEGVLATAGGVVSDGDYTLTFAIYGAQSGGAAAWSEGPVKVKVTGGRFHVRLGSQSPLDGTKLAALPAQWLGVKVGADPELARQRLASVPFALHALSASFGYAAASSPGGAATDLACTGCVSVAELKFDGDMDLGGNSLKAKNGAFSGDVTAGSLTASVVTASSFIGDGSKLTGIKTSSGACKKAGEVVRGIKADGTFDCVSFSGALPKDGISGISNGAVSNVFLEVFSSPTKSIPIPDNTGSVAASNVLVPDVGTVRDLQIEAQVVNTDLSKVSIVLLPPDDKAKGWVLCDPCGKTDEKSLVKTWTVKAPPKSGDIGKWIGKSAKGSWTLKVLDSAFCIAQKPGNKALCDFAKGTDGTLVDWSVKVETLSNSKIHDPLGRVYARLAKAESNALGDGQTLAIDTKATSPALMAQAWLYDVEKKRWLPAATGIETASSCGSCGAGTDGNYQPKSNTTLTAKTWNFKDFIIPKGVTVNVSGNQPLVIRATGKVEIAGVLNLAGKPGADVKPSTNGCSGSSGCAAGGAPGAGGGAGGQGCYGQNGKPGAGSGAGKGGYASGYGSGGGGGGYGTSGAIGVKGASGQTPGAAGGTYAGVTSGLLLGGSGGGSGGYGSAYNSGGSGGGGGGGVVQITSPKITVTGTIDARGGRGGHMQNNCDGGAGGGGSGGGIWLRGGTVSVQGGTVVATGGIRGETVASHSSDGGDGGAGGHGQIRIDATSTITGTTTPTYFKGDASGLGVSFHAFELLQPTPGRVFLTNRSGKAQKVQLVVTF